MSYMQNFSKNSQNYPVSYQEEKFFYKNGNCPYTNGPGQVLIQPLFSNELMGGVGYTPVNTSGFTKISKAYPYECKPIQLMNPLVD